MIKKEIFSGKVNILNKKWIQVVLFIAGNAIGAGELGLPVSLGGVGFWPSIVAVTILYMATLFTALVLADLVCRFRSFDLPSLFSKTLGKTGTTVFNIAYFTLFFCLLVAYWVGIGRIFEGVTFKNMALPIRECIMLGIVLLMFRGFRSIGPLNLLLTMGFVVAFGMLVFHMLQMKGAIPHGLGNWNALNRSLSVILCCCGFHAAIPIVCQQLNFEPKAIRQATLWGTFFPFIFNVMIVFVSFRVLSLEELQSGQTQGLPVFMLLSQKEGFQSCIFWGRIFSFFALITSLIGVSLTMGNAFQDCFSKKSTKWITIVITVLLPFVISIYNPSIFLRMLGLAGGVFLNIIAGILPLIAKIKSKEGSFLNYILLVGFLYVLTVTILSLF